jgi:hypothetical protein
MVQRRKLVDRRHNRLLGLSGLDQGGGKLRYRRRSRTTNNLLVLYVLRRPERSSFDRID